MPRVAEASELLTAMTNPKLLPTFCRLLDEQVSAGDLSKRVELAQSPLSQHLSKLRALKLLSARRDGQSIRCGLASGEVTRVLTTLHRISCAPT